MLIKQPQNTGHSGELSRIVFHFENTNNVKIKVT